MKYPLPFLAALSFIFSAKAQHPLDGYLSGNPTFVTIGTTANKILAPKDLDFHPTRQNEIWVLNRGTSSDASSSGATVVIFEKQNETTYKSKYKIDKSYNHFMNYANAIAMGAMSQVPDGTGSNTGTECIQMAISCEGTNGGDNFMGPTLWPTDTNIYCKRNQTNNLLGSHSDMLHQSPKCAGIAHDNANSYWITDGNAKNLVKYDFSTPHCFGCDDHDDGKVYRYTDVTFGYVSGIASHLVLDKASGWLYIADTGGKKIIRVNTKTGTNVGALNATNENLAEFRKMTGAKQEVFINTGLVQPSGIDFLNGKLIVSDYSTGEIIIYNATGTTGVEQKRFKTASGSAGVSGVKISYDNYIWYVDNKANTLVKVVPGSTTGINKNTTAGNLSIYPSPATQNVFFDFKIEKNETITIEITDVQGRIIDALKLPAEAGNNHIAFDTNKYNSGIYFVKFNAAEKNYLNKLVIQ